MKDTGSDTGREGFYNHNRIGLMLRDYHHAVMGTAE